MDQRGAREPSGAIVVVSDSFHAIPVAVAVLAASRWPVHQVHKLTRFTDLSGADREALQSAVAIITGRVVPIDRASLELAPSMRVLALHTSGSDHVDVEAASERGVVVTHVKGVNATACADMAMGLVLATTRQIVHGDRTIRSGAWTGDLPPSRDLTGSTVGVVGLGQIGRAFVQRVAGFDVRLLAHTRTPDAAFFERYRVEHVDLDALLAASDVVVLTASLTEATRGLIGERELRRMRRHAVLINVARGELVDEEALTRALGEGWIGAAGLDVFREEPAHASPLFGLERTVLTPHLAGLTYGCMAAAATRAARNALDVLDGRVPTDAVNADAMREVT